MANSPASSPAASAAPAWRTPLIIIIAGCTMASLSFGPRSVLGMFLQPISVGNGWGRDVFSLTMAVQNLMWGVAQPFVGAIADRFGTRRVFFAGALMYGAGFAVMALPLPSIAMHILSGVLVGFGLGCVSFNLVLAAFSKLLPENQRASAAGFGTAAGSFGQFLFGPLTIGLLGIMDWRAVLFCFALLPLAMLPLALPLSTPPASATNASGEKAQTIGESLREAFGHPSFVYLVIGFFTCGFQLAFVTSHLPTYLADHHMPAWLGGWSLALIGMFNIAGSLLAGRLSTRMPKRWLLAFIYFGRAISVALFVLLPVTPASALIFAASMGLLWLSTVPPTAGLVTLMFGIRYFGMLYGFAFFSHQVGGFLGSYLGGYLYERTGSYDIVWWSGVLLAVGSGLINLPIREQPYKAAPQPA